ncbi:hypothetical protein Tco_0992589 [Tanacetum coccineum]|uniref:Uncharacterized protein n=1 Tax=Tanacetum coccineum TaxID=301880 RepID=A0ABQ5F2P4_9ASTR
MHLYQLSHSELVGIEKVAVSSSLQSLKPKCTIKSKAKRSILTDSKINIKMEMEVPEQRLFKAFKDQETVDMSMSCVKVTSTQDSERPQDDDKRLHLADDLKKLKDHIQRQAQRNKLKPKV